MKSKEDVKYSIGDKVGRLTILSYVRKPYNAKGYIRGYYHCLCDCGKEIDVVKYRLEDGTTKSCGCLRAKSQKVNVGDLFGELIVLEEVRKQDKRGYWESYYKCKCTCGKETTVRKYELISGNTTSCGCKSSRLSMGKTIVEYTKKQRDYPEDLTNILSNKYFSSIEDNSLTSKDSVEVKCPNCGTYFFKTLGNICYLSGALGYKSDCLCQSCSGHRSKLEVEILEYIRGLYSGIIEQNKRVVLSTRSNVEIDIYIPDLKLGIEVNGIYWHSTKGKSLISIKEKTYHFLKWKYCKDNGIHLISIFEQDWLFKRDKVKSIISDFLVPKNKIYARTTIVKEIDKEVAKCFLDQYHYDGTSNQSIISLGLFSKDTQSLISVMTFGHLRGQNKGHSNKDFYEIVRYATITQTTVIGGASKLMVYFCKKYDPQYILSYSDNDFFLGDIYSKLGFSLSSEGRASIDYQWVKKDLSEVLTRQKVQPWRLQNIFPDLCNEAVNKRISIEDYVMVERGYYKIYRCGNSKWEWNKV